ncbi:MAG: glycosyltransferase family 2 protein [Bilifractor sp.]
MSEKLLTIGVPVYNGGKTLKNMFNLLLPQLNNKVEVVVCNNCSTDNTEKIVNEILQLYPQVKYYRNDHNLGADGNFLKCMNLATGKFTMLISDDDIIVEGAIEKIIEFLERFPQTQLAYLDAVGFKNKYEGLSKCHHYKEFSPVITNNISTKDKKLFLHYAQRLWGFTSTFVWNTERFRSIDKPEKYFGTYFLQSYIHIACSNKRNDLLGIIKGPCIAVGEYGIIGNYDTALIEGVYYRKMIESAVKAGYSREQLEKYYRWKLKHLVSRAIIKEKVAGVVKTHKANVSEATKGNPLLRLYLISLYNIPSSVCQCILKTYRKSKHVSAETYINRPTD